MLLLSVKLPISFGYIFSNEEKFNCLIFSEASLNYLSTLIAKNGFKQSLMDLPFFLRSDESDIMFLVLIHSVDQDKLHCLLPGCRISLVLINTVYCHLPFDVHYTVISL